MFGLGRESYLNNYRRLRTAGLTMNAKILSLSHPLGFDLVKAAQALGIPTPGRTLVLDGDLDIAALSDYLYCEVRINGRSLVELCDPVQNGFTEDEASYLDGYRHSRTSLFRTTAVLPETCQIVLKDLLEPEQPEVHLTDVNFSKSLAQSQSQARILVFLRVITTREIQMSSGNFFVFNSSHKDRLLQSFHQRMKKVETAQWSPRKFVFFYEKQKQFGGEFLTQDLPQF